MRNLLWVVAFAIVAVSCSKNEVILKPVDLDGKVIVINQGNFTEHSASISIYDEQRNDIQNRVFESANGVSIGATIISGVVSPSKHAYLVCNNPDKIEIIDSRTAKQVSEPMTQGLASPRAVAISGNRIYVSNWDYSYVVTPSGFWEFNKSYVAVYDLSTKALIKKVLVGTDAEGLLIVGSKLFVAVKEGVRVLDLTGDNLNSTALIRAAGVTGGAKNLVSDKNGKVWASFPDKGLVQIDPVTQTAVKSVEVPVDFMDGYIVSDGNKVYTYNTVFNASYMPIEAGIYAVDVATGGVNKIFSGTYFYGVGVSPKTGNIITAEVSFTSNSVMKIVGTDGQLKGSATAGIGTCRYLFF